MCYAGLGLQMELIYMRVATGLEPLLPSLYPPYLPTKINPLSASYACCAPPATACRLRRLLAEGRRSELLDLPPQFDADLAAWLADEAAPDAAQRLQIRCGAGQPEWGGQAAPCRLAPEGCVRVRT